MSGSTRTYIITFFFTVIILLAGSATDSSAQVSPSERNFRVEGGMIKGERQTSRAVQVRNRADSLEADSLGVLIPQLDSMRRVKRAEIAGFVYSAGDSIASDSLGISLDQLNGIIALHRTDSIETAQLAAERMAADSLGLTLEEYYALQEFESRAVKGVDTTGMSRRKKRQYEREWKKADTSFVRHNKFFLDSIPISKVTAISLVVPGYAQLYNSQPWKIPVLYGTVGTSTYFWLKEQKVYNKHKKEYDALIWEIGQNDREAIEPVQKKMIKSNTRRQLLMGAAFGSYIYFIGDGAVNYPGATTQVKKATTLSTIFPGAGQVYNKSYWKVPIVLGGFATMAMTIDWNNRGYQRFKRAYDIVSNTGEGETPKDEFGGRIGQSQLKNYKDSYRRNRDLCIILTGAVYLLNVIDAHVDAHMKDYDISDDLASFYLTPSILNTSTQTSGSKNTLGFTFSVIF